MLRALLFAVKIGLIAAAAFWIAQRPGTVAIDWLGYHIDAQIGLVLLLLLACALAMLFLHRVILALAFLPKNLKKRRERKIHEKGYRALTKGLAAVAAGDAREAGDRATKARALWPKDEGLVLLLEAQAARLRGEEDAARAAFDRLLKNRDTAFLGLRGLLADALDGGDTTRALELARRAQTMHPRQPWVLRLVYDLEIRKKLWNDAGKTMKQALRVAAIDEDRARGDQVALLAAQAETLTDKGQRGEAMALLRKAHREDPAFAPVTERLATLLIEHGNRRAAIKAIEETWKLRPHKDLVRLWERLAPHAKNKDISPKLAWFERLLALNPGCMESQLAAARAALDEALWGQAREYLKMALQLGNSARLCRMYAELEDKLYHAESAREWLEKAADAPPDKIWICRETGQIYDRWSPVAKPHGSFNTIVWDYPSPHAALGAQALLPQNEILIAAK